MAVVMDVPRWSFWFSAIAFYCIRFSTGSAGVPQFVKVGCFKDVTEESKRALPELLVNYRLSPYASSFNWSNMSKVVRDCAQEAAKKNYMYFSIQFYGECWSGKTAPLTYDRHGVSSHCTVEVGKENANLVYRFVGKESECLKYKVLDSANRSITHQLQPGSTPSCDYNLHHTWYRFLSPEGNRLASSCVPIGRCGTVVTGYLSSNPPQMTDGIVGGDVSFHFRSNCSMWSQRIQVRNCGRFLVYKLNAPRGCPMRFCTYQAAY